MIVVVASAEPAAAAVGSATVRVKDIDFKPHVTRIHTGARVTWSFDEEYTPHTVHSVGKKRFRSSHTKKYGSTYSVTFKTPGTYRYVCTIHYGMKAKVVVSR